MKDRIVLERCAFVWKVGRKAPLSCDVITEADPGKSRVMCLPLSVGYAEVRVRMRDENAVCQA